MTVPTPLTFDHTLSSKLFDFPVELRRLYGDVQPVTGKIQGVSMGLFQVCSPVSIAPGQDLDLLGGARVIHTRVVDCHKCPSGSYNLQTKLSFDACRRAEPRISTDVPAQLQVLGSSSAISAKIVNLSHAGLGLRLPTAIPVGTIVGVDLGYAIAFGEIRHCSHQIESYLVGVHIHRFTSNDGALSPVSAAYLNGSINPVDLQAFVRSLQERQRRYEAILLSLAFSRKCA